MVSSAQRWLVPALAVVLVGTVGGDIGVAATRHGKNHHSATSPKPTPSPKPTKPPVASRTLALRVGKATLITTKDLSGWKPSGKFGLNTDAGQTGLSCGTLPEGIQGAFEADSPDFTKGPDTISASIAAFPTARGPHEDIVDARTSDAIKCLKAQFADEARRGAGKGARVTQSSLRRIPVPQWGEGSVGLRFQSVVTTSQVPVTVYVDLVGFSLGRVEVVGSFATAFHPPAGSTERRLMSLMEARAKSALRSIG